MEPFGRVASRTCIHPGFWAITGSADGRPYQVASTVPSGVAVGLGVPRDGGGQGRKQRCFREELVRARQAMATPAAMTADTTPSTTRDRSVVLAPRAAAASMSFHIWVICPRAIPHLGQRGHANAQPVMRHSDRPLPVDRRRRRQEGPATAFAGGTIEYSITVTNHGPLTATDVIVRALIDRTLVTVTALPRDCTLPGGTITCSAGTLAVDQTRTFRFIVTVDGGVRPGTDIVNCAVAGSASTLLSLTAAHSCIQAEVVVLPPVPVTG